MHGEDFYTVEEAARTLKLTPERIRQMLRDAELEGVPTQEGGVSSWKIPVRVIHGRDRPPPIRFAENSTAAPERPSEPEDIPSPEEISEEEEPRPESTQPQRDDAAENSREPTERSTLVTVQEAARILETSVNTLLEAKDETIADFRERVAFLERQLEGRAEEIRRRDHIIAALTERIAPAIEAPDREKPQGAPESTAEEHARVAPSSAGGPQTSSESSRDIAEPPVRRSLLRPWWKRVFRR